FANGESYPSNSTEYYYNTLGQLTNITERSGTNSSSTWVAAVDRPRNRFYAALAAVRQIPGRGAGAISGLILGALLILALVGDDVRRLIFRISTGGSRENRGVFASANYA